MSLPRLECTHDGSYTLYHPRWKEHYHSLYGARTESMHVFIHAGLAYAHRNYQKDTLSIFELGFGTGLNAYLSMQYAAQEGLKLHYEAVDTCPLGPALYEKLSEESGFQALHTSPWGNITHPKPFFALEKHACPFETYTPQRTFDVFFFDAFSPQKQPALWTSPCLRKAYDMLHEEAVLVSYAAQSAFRRTLQKLGFCLEILPGPRGKREMTRALKKQNHQKVEPSPQKASPVFRALPPRPPSTSSLASSSRPAVEKHRDPDPCP